MAVYRYDVRCTDDQCKEQEACYKIAAKWTGGGFTELKTFGFANDVCLERVYRAAKKRAARIRTVEGEELGLLQIYRLDRNQHDYDLTPLPELQAALDASEPGTTAS